MRLVTIYKEAADFLGEDVCFNFSFLYTDVFSVYNLSSGSLAEIIDGKKILCFNEEKNLKEYSFEKPLIVLGITTYKWDEDFDEEEEELECWNLIRSKEEFEEWMKNDDILKIKYVFDVDDDIYEQVISEAEKKIKENEDFLMRRIHLKGDVIITDPCYILDNSDKKHSFFEFDIFETSKYLSRDTLYGDWSCTTYNSDTKEAIGQFCADSGYVAVFLLEDVLKFNPEFDYHITKPWTTTWIKDFEGDIWFEKLNENTLIVKGSGNINFVTKQTGL